jgi:hypothetical protein
MFVTVRSIALILVCSDETVRREIKRRAIPIRTLGRSWRLAYGDVRQHFGEDVARECLALQGLSVSTLDDPSSAQTHRG